MPTSSIALIGSGLLVWGVERQDGSGNIKTLPDALWWAVTTITTVGYGDKFPVTPEGRAIAVVLMFLGIALFGVITATLASFFVEHQSQNEFQQVMARLDALEERLLGTDLTRANEEHAPTAHADPNSDAN